MTRTVVASDDPMIDPERIRAVLAEAGVDAEVRVADTGTEQQLVEAAAGADAIVLDVNTAVTEAVLTHLPDLEVVGRAGVGVDNVDVGAADDHGVVVFNVPDYCTDEVATHAFALLLACARRLAPYDAAVADGSWSWTDCEGVHRFSGETVGLHSFGPIARRLAERLSGFDTTLVAADPYVDADTMAEYGVEKVDFGTMLDRADHVSVHAPLTPETRGLFDADAFDRMADHATLVNTGRGGIVDEADLHDALADGDIAAAGLDVMAQEPPEDSPLFDRDDCIVTPHAGWYSVEAREDLNTSVGRDLAAAFAGEEPDGWIDPSLDWV